MAAATTYSDYARRGNKKPRNAVGITYVDRTIQLATTELDDVGDIVALFLFPESCVLADPGSWVITLTDVDSNGAPALAWDLKVSDLASSPTETTLISGSTTGQAAGSDYLDNVASPTAEVLLDLSNQYLIFEVTTAAATAAAGTLQFRIAYSSGVIAETQSDANSTTA